MLVGLCMYNPSKRISGFARSSLNLFLMCKEEALKMTVCIMFDIEDLTIPG